MPRYYEFEVSLAEVQPRLWRRFLIREAATFLDLHEAIQDACGWLNYHLFVFTMMDRAETAIAGIPDDEFEPPVPDAKRVKLSSYFLGKTKSCRYQYDFGDGWDHDVVLCDTVDLPGTLSRRLLAGARAFPHEDCGGLPGYENCAKVATGEIEDTEGLLKWLEGWHPETFDLDDVKKRFDRPRKRSAARTR